MSAIETLAEGIVLHPGDCLYRLPDLDANSIDSCVTDPPYELKFMGKNWDGTGVAFQRDTWERVYRVLKPGAHLLSFGGTRTYHRMACAIEDAGFEIRDCIQWIYGSGFPKSLDVSKAIDRAAGAEREVVGLKSDPRYLSPRRNSPNHMDRERGVDGGHGEDHDAAILTAPATPAARQWSGFGTALKPACEPIVLARKPLSESTVAANVLKWGTGALNIDGCRVATDEQSNRAGGRRPSTHEGYQRPGATMYQDKTDWSLSSQGRWPANVIHDGSDEVMGAFPDTETHAKTRSGYEHNGSIYSPRDNDGGATYDSDSGSAARFFYNAKADQGDRLGSKHPTVKPVDLIQYLVRLVTPPRGLVLDPFAGTGTLGEACIREGFRAILIEKEAEYCDDIRRRMKLAMAGPFERAFESHKARNKDKPEDHGPLFGGLT